MKKPTVPVRSQMLAKFDVFAGAFAHCVHTLQPFGVAVSELQNWVYKVRFGLETAPFLGLVVKSHHLHTLISVFMWTCGIRERRNGIYGDKIRPS